MVPYRFSNPWAEDPWSALDQLRRGMDEMFERRGERGSTSRSGVYPAVNLYETSDGYVLTAELPGVRREDLDVSVEGNRVTLRGERRVEHPQGAEASLHRLERASGVFRRAFELPSAVDSSKAEAVYRNGVLMLRIPKAQEARPRTISVKAG